MLTEQASCAIVPTNKVDMYGNRYPLEDALKLFGAAADYGARAIKN